MKIDDRLVEAVADTLERRLDLNGHTRSGILDAARAVIVTMHAAHDEHGQRLGWWAPWTPPSDVIPGSSKRKCEIWLEQWSDVRDHWLAEQEDAECPPILK